MNALPGRRRPLGGAAAHEFVAAPSGLSYRKSKPPMSLSAHYLLPRRRALCFAGPLRTAPAPNAGCPAVMF